jgi:hypothetical protein
VTAVVEFVIHRQILVHEDAGMMPIIIIVPDLSARRGDGHDARNGPAALNVVRSLDYSFEINAAILQCSDRHSSGEYRFVLAFVELRSLTAK